MIIKRESLYKLLSVLLLLSIVLFYYKYNKTRLDKYGVYTLAKCVRWEPDSEGSTSVFDIYFQGKTYQVNTSGNYEYKINKIYVVKIDPSKPQQIGTLIEEASLCVLQESLPQNGWKELPKCR